MFNSVVNCGCELGVRLSILIVGFCVSPECAFAVGNDKAPTRTEEITTVVIHAIGGPVCKNGKVVFTEAPGDSKRWKKWFEGQRGVSIHYVVDRDGNVEKSINEDRVAWHAKGYNKNSIGIELVNKGDGVEEYPAKQVLALKELVQQIINRHKGITKDNVVRHSDIDNRTFYCGGRKINRKQDPGPTFPYQDVISKLSPRPLLQLFQ